VHFTESSAEGVPYLTWVQEKKRKDLPLSGIEIWFAGHPSGSLAIGLYWQVYFVQPPQYLTTLKREYWRLFKTQNRRRVKRGKTSRSLFAQQQANFLQQQCITTWSLFLISTLNVPRFILSDVSWLYSKDVTTGWSSAWREVDRQQVTNHALMFVTPSNNVSGQYVVENAGRNHSVRTDNDTFERVEEC